MEVKDMCEAWDGAVKLQAQIEGRVIAQELAPKMAEEMAAKIAKDMAADMAPKMAEEMAGEMAEEIVEKRLKEHKQRLKRKEKERNKKVVYNMFAKGYPQEEISEILNDSCKGTFLYFLKRNVGNNHRNYAICPCKLSIHDKKTAYCVKKMQKRGKMLLF